MKLLVLILVLAVYSVFPASAEMSAITVPASVVKFDKKTITIRVNEKNVTVPREIAGNRELKKGESILLTFRGRQISHLLSGDKESRSPASERGRK